MSTLTHLVTAATHQTYGLLLRASGRSPDAAAIHPLDASPAWDARSDVSVDGTGHRDVGAVSLEQVLWFVAAGVSVAVVAAIIWGQIRDQAETPVDAPTAP